MTPKQHLTTLLAIPLMLACGGGGGGNGDPDGTSDAVEDSVEDGTDDVAVDVAEDSVEDPAEDTGLDPVEDVEEDGEEDAPEDSTTSGIVGDACSEAGDCGGITATDVRCLDTLTVGSGMTITFPEGYCSAACTEDGDCGGDATCERFGSDLNLCLDGCTEDADCRESDGYECRTRMTGDETFCLPSRD